MKRVCLGLLQNLGMRRATSPKTNAAKKIPSTRVEVNNKKHTVQNKSDDFCGETINTRGNWILDQSISVEKGSNNHM